MRPAKLWKIALEKSSRLILALDSSALQPLKLVEMLEEHLAGIKVGLSAFLKWGTDRVVELNEEFSHSLYTICDLKLSDIPYVVGEELKLIRSLKFDGTILHLFQGGVEEVVRLEGRPDLYGIVAMSHPQSLLLDRCFESILDYAARLRLEGYVVPATKANYVKAVRTRMPNCTLLAPGVGAQGAEPGSAIAAGADFEIVGRAITASGDPLSACRSIKKLLMGFKGGRFG
ncbi:MAG: hypothetical protein DRJ43_01880 [Thermoprotei archaeon]|nr:MAG: hypothetical protein DRJ43_01880 [Thermoprotei archaeon]